MQLMRRFCVLLTLGFALAAAPCATDANAKPYEVLSCGAAPGGASHAWTAFNTAPWTLTASRSCPPLSDRAGELTGLSAHDTLRAPTETQPGGTTGFDLTAPSGTTITGWDYVGGVDKYDDDDWTVALSPDPPMW